MNGGKQMENRVIRKSYIPSATSPPESQPARSASRQSRQAHQETPRSSSGRFSLLRILAGLGMCVSGLALAVVSSVLLAQVLSVTVLDGLFVTEPIEVNHGESMWEVLEGIRDEECEVFVAFDSNGNKLFECTSNDPIKVDVPIPLQQTFKTLDGYTIAHNHPAGDAPFSDADIVCASNMSARESIVVSPNYTYRMEPPETGWPTTSAIVDWFENVREIYPNDSDVWELVPVYDNESKRYCTGICSTDKLMELFINDFGGKYVKMRAPTINNASIDTPY